MEMTTNRELGSTANRSVASNSYRNRNPVSPP